MDEKGTFFPLLTERLKKLRTENHLTQKELAEELSKRWKEQGRGTGKTGQLLTDKTYKNYEQGKSYPKLETISFIADFYDVSVDYLLGRSDYTRVSNELIGKKLGLNNSAIYGLRIAHDIMLPEKRELYNFCLSSPEAFYLFENFYKYVFCNYKIPVCMDEGGGTPHVIPHSFFEGDRWSILLASSVEKPNDFAQVYIDDTFFMNIAREKILKNLDNIKKEYLEKIKKSDGGKNNDD